MNITDLTPLQYLTAINRAQLAGYDHLAAALLELYRIQFPSSTP